MPKRGSMKSAGKRQESATFLQRSFFNVALQFFVCCSTAFGQNDMCIAEKPMLQCNFCSAAFRLLQSTNERCHSTNSLSRISFQIQVLCISTQKFPRKYLLAQLAMLLPAEVRPCQATCSHTNLEDPKQQARSQQEIPFQRNSISKYLST